MTVVTRFAPSPTGFLHIGGARTALFNWLYAKRFGGKMLLRIEDTDRERSTAPAIAAIIDGLTWLDLSWDGDIVFQFSRAERHRQIAEQLLAEGKAYRCYASPEELTTMREAARAEGRSKLYDGRWRDRDPSDAPPGIKPVIRLKAPQTGETVVEDQVQGRVVWQNENLDDFVLLRSDGNPTYMLAVVVDDHDMAVTHIIRGDDHLNNAARQTLIYQAMGWEVPSFAHIPLIHGDDGAKLSKRHGATAVTDFATLGYLPEALRNYLARLGWSHGDDELFSDDQAIAWFDIADANKGASRLDWDKLNFVNGHYIRLADDGRLADLVGEVFATRGEPLDAARKAHALRAIPLVKERARTLLELADQLAFLFHARPIQLDEKARGQLTDETAARLLRLQADLATANDWSAEALEALLKAFAESEGVGFGKFAPALRAILTGGAASPDLGRTLSALGREESLARLDDALSPAA